MSKREPKLLLCGWMQSVGFLFVALTTVPIFLGLHVGMYFDHGSTGALVGAAIGVALAIWLVIRPIWLDAGKDPSATDDSDE
jgi:hypothetical protein